MTVYLRDILPRVELLRQDRLPGKYPTYARTGDLRRGNNSFFFDDTITILFQENIITSYPTTLPEGHKLLAPDLSSSILSAGTITKTGTEQFVVLPEQNETFVSFKEDKFFAEDIKTDAFYLTGSDISDVGLGFTNKLGSKTIIKIPLLIAESMTFPSQTKGDYYYNKDLKRWDSLDYKGISPTFSQNPSHRRAFGQPFSYGNRAAILFNCFGTPQSDNWAANAGAFAFTTYLASAGSILDYKGSSLLTSGGYAATSSQFLDIASYLHAPFLLEKAHLELPFQSGPNWFASPTAHSLLDGFVSLTVDQTYVDGPAVTFGLLNQLSDSNRDIILSGTIVPERDCTPWFEEYFNAFGTAAFRTLNGFTRFATPSFKVPSSDFLGNARLPMDAAQSHGIIYEGILTESARYYGFGAVDETPSVAPWGRGHNGSSGRSIFGGEFVLPRDNSILRDSTFWDNLPIFTASDPVYDPYLVSGIQNKKSPYLISPKDRLVAYLTIGGPAMYTWRGDDGFGGPAFDWQFSGSHEDAGIPAGTAFLTLYGSFIKEEVEFHDTLNQRLETNQIHEIIGNDPVLDQFDVAYDFELSGSYFDRVSVMSAAPYVTYGSSRTLSASFETTRFYSHFGDISSDDNSWGTGNNFAWARLKKIYELKKNSRNSIFISENETFWDSRIPDPSEIIRVQSPAGSLAGGDADIGTGNVASLQHILYSGRTPTFIGEGSPPTTSVSNRGLGDWMMSFPFEAKYSAVTSMFSDKAKGMTTLYKEPGVAGQKGPAFVRFEQMGFEFGESSGSFTRTVASEELFGFVSVGVGHSEFMKYFFGFGDGRSSIDNGHVKCRGKEDYFGLGVCAEIRGWKYGLISGFPLKSSATFRRDRFGQFRDMLEQRPDTKWYESTLNRVGALSSPVSVKFVTQNGENTLPQFTFSSNLSTEATSSLPYFDGLVRNREEPLVYAQINQNNVVI